MSERKAGWYWVKTIDHDAPEYWEPAFFSNGEWDHDLSIKIVGPRIPTSDELWRPENCRNELQAKGKPYPRSGCAVCGNGGLAGCPYERQRKPEDS